MFKVLIVDDEPQIRTGLRTIVPWESYGFEIAGEAFDGISALQHVEQTPPDLVITDVRMPRMDGMELARELGRRYPNICILVLSGYNEFTFAKGALQAGAADYLLKPVCPDELGGILGHIYEQLLANLKKRMKEQEEAHLLKDLFLNKLIRGEIYTDIIHKGAAYNLKLEDGPYQIMIVAIRRYGEILISRPEYEIGLTRFALVNIISELLPPDCYLFEITADQFGIILTNAAAAGEAPRELGEEIIVCTWKYAKEQVLVGIGEAATQHEGIPHAYTSAKKALEQRFFWPNQQLFVKLEADKHVHSSFVQWDDQALCALIREGSHARMEEEIQRMLAPLLGGHTSIGTLKWLVIPTIIKLAKMTEEHHGEWHSFYTARFEQLERIMTSGSLPELGRLLYEISSDISDHIQSVSGRKLDSRIHEVVSYIEHHYPEELNLKELSKLFYINTVYLGQLFKKETGLYFNDYVNQTRLKQATRLLLDTNRSTAEIATSVGYNYVDHFYRLFKQQMGMTPGEYRKANCLV